MTSIKKSEIKEILALGSAAISGKITELKSELAKANLDLKRGKVKNLRLRKNLRHSIAVLMTLQTQGAK